MLADKGRLYIQCTSWANDCGFGIRWPRGADNIEMLRAVRLGLKNDYLVLVKHMLGACRVIFIFLLLNVIAEEISFSIRKKYEVDVGLTTNSD